MSKRYYHVIFINEEWMEKTYMTGYPMSHRQCMTMIGKCSPKSYGRYQVEEAKSSKDFAPIGTYPCPEYSTKT